jgi:hypothetical protein
MGKILAFLKKSQRTPSAAIFSAQENHLSGFAVKRIMKGRHSISPTWTRKW